MADNATSFETDAVGVTPKGWTATKTWQGRSEMDGRTGADRAVEIESG